MWDLNRRSDQNKDLSTSVRPGLDRGMLLAVFFLIGLGLVQVYSSSYIFATEVHGDGLYFFRKQVLFAALGMGALLGVGHLPWRWAERLGWTLWAVSVLGIVGTFIPGVGVRVGGGLRWLALPFGYRFEPGELFRATFPFVLAPLIAKFTSAEKLDRGWWLRLGLVLLPVIVLCSEPDFGSFVIVLSLTFALFMAFGLRWRYIVGGFSVLAPIVSLMILTSPYRRARLDAFLNPWADPAEKGFQVIQSLVSFYSGGLTGVGPGQGLSKLFFLPEAHTDFTLAVLGEEMGFVGFLVLMMVYGFLIFRGFQITLRLRCVRQRALALSFSLLTAISVFINAGVALGLLPTKGLTLPLLSYGGSSLICTGLCIGWLLNLGRESIVP